MVWKSNVTAWVKHMKHSSIWEQPIPSTDRMGLVHMKLFMMRVQHKMP